MRAQLNAEICIAGDVLQEVDHAQNNGALSVNSYR